MSLLYKNIFSKTFLVAAMLVFALCSSHCSLAQGQKRVVQLSGLVVSGDSLFGLPGANVYVAKAGRGTSTNEFGYFSMPVLAGDSVTVSMVGFKKYNLFIPTNYSRESYSVIIELKEDPTMLPVVDVFPYATEEVFKEAFLALRLPTKDKTNAEKNLDEQLLRRIFSNMPMDGAQNQQWAQQQFSRQQEMRGTVPANPLLNPFAWSELINSIKRGDFKKRKGVDFDEERY